MFKKGIFILAAMVVLVPFGWAKPAEKLEVVLFTSPYCGHCQRLKKEYLPEFKKTFGKQIALVQYDVSKAGDNIVFNDTLDEYKVNSKGVPAMVVGKQVLMGYPTQIKTGAAKAIATALENNEKTYYGTKDHIAQCKLKEAVADVVFASEENATAGEENPDGKSCDKSPTPDGTAAAKALFEQITLAAIIAAGLIDGINPCAFAVIVFFVSFLAAYKYNRKEIVLVGSAYCFSVFVAYVLIGLGLFNFLYAMRSFYYVMMAFKWITIGLCALFFLLSLYDFIIYRLTQNHNKIVLQLSKSNKEYIHKVMRVFLKDKQGSAWRLVVAAVCVGFVVSLVEAVCTGQVYLPTIALILKEAGQHFWRAMTYLLVYNLMFIVPLVVILVLSILGYESSTFNSFFKKHLGLTKLLLSLLFLGLLVLLIFNM